MAKQTKALVEQAGALGIEVDRRWGDETLQEKIDVAVAAAKAKEALTDGEGDPATSGEAGSAIEEPAAEAAAIGGGQDAPGDDAAQLAGGSARGADVGPDAVDGSSALVDVQTGDDSGTHRGGSPGLPVDEGADLGDDSAGVDPTTVAYRAMKEPILAALHAASAVYGAFTGGVVIDLRWLTDGPRADPAIIYVVDVLVPFVRSWPEAPAEALYLHTRSEAPQLGHVDPWAELSPARRLAWEMFRDVLIKVDAIVAAERARIAAIAAEPRGVRQVPADESTLELVDDPFALSDTGRAAARR